MCNEEHEFKTFLKNENKKNLKKFVCWMVAVAGITTIVLYGNVHFFNILTKLLKG